MRQCRAYPLGGSSRRLESQKLEGLVPPTLETPPLVRHVDLGVDATVDEGGYLQWVGELGKNEGDDNLVALWFFIQELIFGDADLNLL